MLKVLFICSQNLLRSPTAEEVFRSWPGIEVQSAGLDPTADNPITVELVVWADLVFVMESKHKRKLTSSFQNHCKDKRIICLDVPDKYDYMQPALIRMLKRKVSPFLPK